MKVFLVNEINKYDSVGINLLSSILKNKGHEARVFLVPDLIYNTTIDLKFLNIAKFAFHISDEKYIDYILSFKPDVIGFSVVTMYWKRASRLAQIIKRKAPHVLTIAGGPHTTVAPIEDMFGDLGFDYIVKGDGEISLPKLIEAFEAKNYSPEIPGVYYLNSGIIQGSGMGELPVLDELPFQDKSDVWRDYPFFQHLYTVNSQRSCQFSCTYCGSPKYRDAYYEINERIFRRRSVDNLVKELYDAKRANPKMEHVGFFDDTFTSGKQWIRDFAREYKKYVKLPYFMCTNPCLMQDEDLIYQLKESGLSYCEVGIQAIDEEYRMKKVLRPDKDSHIFDSTKYLRKHGVYFQVNHIFGLDRRDFDDDNFLKETVEYYLKVNPNWTHCFELDYFPACEETERALKEGRITQEFYDGVNKGESSISYNFGNIIEQKRRFAPYIVLLQMMPFLPHSLIRVINRSKFLFYLVKKIPFHYVILARLLNTLKGGDMEGSPHFGKYIDGAFRILSIKKHLRLFRSGKVNNGHNGSPPSGFIESDSQIKDASLVLENSQT